MELIELIIAAFVGLITLMVHGVILLFQGLFLVIEFIVYLLSRGPGEAKTRATKRRLDFKRKHEQHRASKHASPHRPDSPSQDG